MSDVTINGVEVFREGTWRDHDYTGYDLTSMAVGYKFLIREVPVTVSHGGPAVGNVKEIRREGDRLVADLVVGEETAERIRAGDLHSVSVNLVFDCGCVVNEIALLGEGEHPYCEGLAPLRKAMRPKLGPGGSPLKRK